MQKHSFQQGVRLHLSLALLFKKTELLSKIERIHKVASTINNLVKASEIVKRLEESNEYAN